MGPEVIKRFWKRVNKTKGSCWLWTGASWGRGSGVFYDGYRCVSAHRFSYLLKHGPFPENMKVLQTCSNKLCCRPGHLILATAGFQGCRDRRNRKLSDSQIEEIRNKYKSSKYTQAELAEEYGVTQSFICRILSNKRYSVKSKNKG